MDISCVVNAHREGNIVFPTLQSVHRSVLAARDCGLDVEIIVVLDRPDRRTSEIAHREITAGVKVHTVDYGDLSDSRNRGVGHCSGKYVAFIDGDDLWCRLWLIDAYLAAEREERRVIFHPEYNVYFGSSAAHVFHHVDMEDADYQHESLLRSNYWTALSFARRDLYKEFPYLTNRINDGFGFEDWTWNYETARAGILHKTVAGTSHFVRKGKSGDSLLALTNRMKALPRILDLYTDDVRGTRTVSPEPFDRKSSEDLQRAA